MLKQALSRSPYRVCCWRVAIPVQSHESIRNGWWPGDSVWHIMYFSLHTHLSFCFHFMKCFYLWSASDVWFWFFFPCSNDSFPNKSIWQGSDSAWPGALLHPGTYQTAVTAVGCSSRLPLQSSTSWFFSPWLMQFPHFTISSSSQGAVAQPA